MERECCCSLFTRALRDGRFGIPRYSHPFGYGDDDSPDTPGRLSPAPHKHGNRVREIVFRAEYWKGLAGNGA